MLPLNPLFEREWRERFRRPVAHFQLGGLVVALCAVLCFGVWRAAFEAAPAALAWRANGRMLLDFYRVGAGLLFWCGALLLGSVSVSDEKTGATWEHLLLCPVGGRGLSVGKIASSAAYLVALQAALLPVLLVAGQCFGASTTEIAGVMISHFLLTVQGATLGFWGALRGKTLAEGLLESIFAIGRIVVQTVALLVIASWIVVLLGGALTAAATLSPSSIALILKWTVVVFLGALFVIAKGVASFVAGLTGLGVLAQSVRAAQFALWPPLLWAGQLAGVALFLKWSAWEVDYPAREFWSPAPAPIATARTMFAPPPQLLSRSQNAARPQAVRASTVRPTNFSAPAPRPTPTMRGRVPSPFEEHGAPHKGAPPLFGTSAPPARPAPSPPAHLKPGAGPPYLPASMETQIAFNATQNSSGETRNLSGQTRNSSGETRNSSPFPPASFQAQNPSDATRNMNGSRAFTPPLTRFRVLYGAWNWMLSPEQLAVFPAKERRESLAKTSQMLPTWEQTFAPPSKPEAKQTAVSQTVRRMRAPVSRRFQEWNPVLWLDLTRCLSLRSPDSKMVPVLLSCAALGGSFVFAIALFLGVGWVQNALGGARGDVSSLRSTWDNLHGALLWGALAFGPLWGATGYVIERRTGMLVELRLTLLSARAVWWGKFGARFGIFAALSAPMLALVTFFACNWPDKNGAFETWSALVSSYSLAAWSLLACLWISDSCRRELAAGLWCGAFGVSWGVLLWNFPALWWTPLHMAGAVFVGGHLWRRLKVLGFG